MDQVVTGCAPSAPSPFSVQSEYQAAAAREALGLGAAAPAAAAAAREAHGRGAAVPTATRELLSLGAATRRRSRQLGACAWCNWCRGRRLAQVEMAKGQRTGAGRVGRRREHVKAFPNQLLSDAVVLVEPLMVNLQITLCSNMLGALTGQHVSFHNSAKMETERQSRRGIIVIWIPRHYMR